MEAMLALIANKTPTRRPAARTLTAFGYLSVAQKRLYRFGRKSPRV